MFAVLIPVGPGPVELARLDDTLDSLRAHEPAGEIHLVLVDDAPQPRPELQAIDWPERPVIVRTPLWGPGRRPPASSAMVAGSLMGLSAAAESRPDFCLKLDTDALVIAPFADKLRAAFAEAPSVGMLGSYDRTCTGARREWDHKGRVVAATPRPLSVWRRSPLGLPTDVRYTHARDRRRARALIAQARANGYELGAHCLGGAYAVSSGFLARSDLFDWRPWVRTWDCSEDVVVSLLVFAAGLQLKGLVGRDQPFGLAWRGLPASPEWLMEHGASLIHSLKDHQGSDEGELRAWFRAHAR